MTLHHVTLAKGAFGEHEVVHERHGDDEFDLQEGLLGLLDASAEVDSDTKG